MSAEPSVNATSDLEVPEETLAAAREVFSLLLKGIKNIGIYRHAEARYPEYIAPAHAALEKFIEEHAVLPLKLSPYTLEYKKNVIYEDNNKENLTYKFYKDGMRFLIFRPGVTADELLRFVLLSLENLSEAALFQEDMVTRLWKEDFQSIEYVVVEGFGFADISEEEVALEVDKIVGYLRMQLAANSDDVTRFARLSPEDLELELTDIDQVRGGIISGRTATDADKTWIQEELYHEEQNRIFAKAVLILFQVIELDGVDEDFDMLLDSVTQVLDRLLVSEDVSGAVALLTRFEKIASRKTGNGDLVMKLRDSLRRRMTEAHRLGSIGSYLSLAKKLDIEAVRTYLSACSDEELIPLVEMLASTERQEARAVLIDVLAVLGKGHADVFARRLDSNSSNVVKDMLAIIHRIDPPGKIKMVAKCLDHPNIMIRLEGLKTLAKAQGSESIKYLEKAAADEDLNMRLGAYRALVHRSAEKAAPILIKMISRDGYGSLASRERLALMSALGETKTDSALEFFSSVFQQKAGLFSRGKANELKLLAISGLTSMKSVPAFKILAREVQNRGNSKEVMESAHKAALRLKEELQTARDKQRSSDG